MRSGPEYFRLGRRELIVCECARGVQLCEVFDLVGRVRRRGRILRLVLAVAGRRLVLLVVGRRLVIGLLLLRGLLVLVVCDRRSGNDRPPPCPSPETHGKLLPSAEMTPWSRNSASLWSAGPPHWPVGPLRLAGCSCGTPGPAAKPRPAPPPAHSSSRPGRSGRPARR